MKSALFLDIVIRKGAAVLKLLASKDKTLVGLDVVNGVRRLDFQSDGLARQCLDKDLHPTTETENKMVGRLLSVVIIRESSAVRVFQLFARKDQTLLVGRDPAPRQISN